MNRTVAFAVVALLVAAAPVIATAEANKACGLLTAAELESVLAAKVSGLSSGATGVKDVQMCTGSTPAARILLRIAKSRGNSKDAAAKGIEIARQMGAQVDLKTFGPITCSSFIPPKDKEVYGFNTTCTVTKGDSVAGVEITAKSRAAMIPIDKLHPLAEKMAARF